VGLQLIGNYWSESQLLSVCINTNKTRIGIPNVRQLLRRMHNGSSSKKPKSLLIDGWEVVIGIEIHTQLATQSKIFSGSSTEFGQDPNTQASLVDLAMPGVLPVLNKVVDLAIRFGLGIDAYIDQASVFARKNYFYPDSPKGYQISQMDNPIVGLGHIDIQLEDGTVKRIGVTRAHLEEDAGKSIHDQFEGMSGIDLNRAGTPLLEIVSEPDMRSVEEAVAYIKSIHTLVRWLVFLTATWQKVHSVPTVTCRYVVQVNRLVHVVS
jgi:aspartyl-tRNA(Asn)/glutamyl-tRNA(Gln) amidotransferase subunit B